MPYPPPSRALSAPRRRSLLASAAGGALLAGCSSGSGPSEENGGGRPSAAERARARAARDSADLLERYDAVLAAFPGLAERLVPLRAEVALHAEAFGGGGGTATPSPSAPSATASASASVTASASATAPADEKSALSGLAAAERALADRRTAALDGLPGELARLLASVAAAGAAHAYLLTEGAR
ncbi:hypothetical protein [Streptomyces sp. H51]|uniref:hypothetical protein n=1 Tax=Streptomyces sp. H51 TaxID=3111770 RepID=UPI002D791622|nr:hypothetical protein [Streptomyces sp. H51]